MTGFILIKRTYYKPSGSSSWESTREGHTEWGCRMEPPVEGVGLEAGLRGGWSWTWPGERVAKPGNPAQSVHTCTCTHTRVTVHLNKARKSSGVILPVAFFTFGTAASSPNKVIVEWDHVGRFSLWFILNTFVSLYSILGWKLKNRVHYIL